MASLPSRDQVLDELPEIAEFRPIMLGAWRRWQDEIPAGTKKDLDNSTRAIIVHNLTVSEAVKYLDGIAVMHDKWALKLFTIRDYAVRFKKLDTELMSRNQETDQVKAFMAQLPLSGIPAIYHLEVGYVLDKLGTEIAETHVVCPNGFKNAPYWNIELHNDGYELSDVVDLFPENPPPNSSDNGEERGSRWKRRESGVIIPFDRSKRPR
jgi:hypothetical protein